jgi:cysteine-rich repeat protein
MAAVGDDATPDDATPDDATTDDGTTDDGTTDDERDAGGLAEPPDASTAEVESGQPDDSANDAGEVPNPSICGNGTRDAGESCDDGNLEDGDGCAADCVLEHGWGCPPGEACRRVAPAVSIAAGQSNTCAILADGRSRCWGDNRYGQLGYGDDLPRGQSLETMGVSVISTFAAMNRAKWVVTSPSSTWAPSWKLRSRTSPCCAKDLRTVRSSARSLQVVETGGIAPSRRCYSRTTVSPPS